MADKNEHPEPRRFSDEDDRVERSGRSRRVMRATKIARGLRPGQSDMEAGRLLFELTNTTGQEGLEILKDFQATPRIPRQRQTGAVAAGDLSNRMAKATLSGIVNNIHRNRRIRFAIACRALRDSSSPDVQQAFLVACIDWGLWPNSGKPRPKPRTLEERIAYARDYGIPWAAHNPDVLVDVRRAWRSYKQLASSEWSNTALRSLNSTDDLGNLWRLTPDTCGTWGLEPGDIQLAIDELKKRWIRECGL